jgi:hypothetical protein
MPKKPRVKQAAQKFAEAVASPKPVRNVGNSIVQSNPRAVSAGNTKLSADHPKAIALKLGRPSNLRSKSEFTKKEK